MNWKELAEKITPLAPLAGAVIGGPAGAAVVATSRLISSALGVDNTPEAVSAALERDPDAALKLQEMNNTHQERLQELAITQFREERLDRQGAREAHKHSRMPAAICIMLTLLVAVYGFLLFTIEIPAGNKVIADILFGALVAKWGDSIAYWVGTTRSSAQKTSLMASK